MRSRREESVMNRMGVSEPASSTSGWLRLAWKSNPRRLVEDGYIRMKPNAARGIVLVEPPPT